MKNWFISLNGAIVLSVLALLSEVWRGFLDAMFVLPVDFDDPLMMNLAAILIGQTWSIALLGLVSMPLVYLDTLKTDQYCLEKFGDDYKHYMETVPAVNLVTGTIRLLGRKRPGETGLRSP